MENASKALIMAAGVLIGLLIISIAIFLFVNFKYLTNSNYLYCVIGNCENYQSEIDYILTEYQTISSIL